MTPYGRQSSRVPRVPVAPMASAPWRNVAAAGLFVGLGWAAPQLGDRLSGPIAAAVAAPTSPETNTAPGVTFVAQATGVTLGAVDVYDAPAGGAVSAVLPQGAPVAIGGRILVPAGLWNRDVLWVRLSASGTKPDAATTAAYGFVPADTVAVTAGTPLRLGIDAVTRASLASPASAIQYAGGEGRAQITADVHVPSGAVPTLAAAPDPSEAAHAPVPGAADAPGIGAAADIGIAWLPETVARWQPDIVAAAAAHGIDPKLAAIVMLVESGGDPTALSPSGARGLMQVMPGTGADIARRYCILQNAFIFWYLFEPHGILCTRRRVIPCETICAFSDRSYKGIQLIRSTLVRLRQHVIFHLETSAYACVSWPCVLVAAFHFRTDRCVFPCFIKWPCRRY